MVPSSVSSQGVDRASYEYLIYADNCAVAICDYDDVTPVTCHAGTGVPRTRGSTKASGSRQAAPTRLSEQSQTGRWTWRILNKWNVRTDESARFFFKTKTHILYRQLRGVLLFPYGWKGGTPINALSTRVHSALEFMLTCTIPTAAFTTKVDHAQGLAPALACSLPIPCPPASKLSVWHFQAHQLGTYIFLGTIIGSSQHRPIIADVRARTYTYIACVTPYAHQSPSGRGNKRSPPEKA